MIGALAAARLAGRSDWPRWDHMVAVGVVVTLLAGLGAARLLGWLSGHWWWMAAGSLVSAAGVWAGVPETGPVVLAAGVLAGLTATAALTGSRWTPAAGPGVIAIIGWAALSGATGRPWATVGGALCVGVAPWFALPSLLPFAARRRLHLWVLVAHTALVVLAARWIGVNPHAGWGRVVVLVAVGLIVATVFRPRA